MSKVRVELSRAEFFRAVQLRYYYVRLSKDVQVNLGDIIILENTEYKGDDSLTCLLVRKVIDWDAEEFMDCKKKNYYVAIENENYLS